MSGVYRVDPSRAFIIRIRNNAEPEEPGREEFEVPGAGAIRFVESIDDRITRFRFDGDREGFFDLAENRIDADGREQNRTPAGDTTSARSRRNAFSENGIPPKNRDQSMVNDLRDTPGQSAASPAPVRTPRPYAYSPLITKNEPRIVPASFERCRANLNRLSSSGTSIPSDSLNPTARFFGSSSVYITLTDSPFS